MLRHLIAALLILGIGMLLGYRPGADLTGVLSALALLIAIGFGVGWVFLVLGLVMRTPNTVMTMGFTGIMPLVFASTIMVDPGTARAGVRSQLFLTLVETLL